MFRTVLVWTLVLFVASFFLLHDAHPHHHHPDVLFGGEPASLFHGDTRKVLFLVLLGSLFLLAFAMVVRLLDTSTSFFGWLEDSDERGGWTPNFLASMFRRGVLHTKAW